MNKDDQNDLLGEAVFRIKNSGEVFETDGTPTVTVKLPDGTFRKKPAPPTAYYMAGAYVGSRDTIFCFTPEDPQEWIQIEVPAKDMDQVFPLFLNTMQEWASARFMQADAARGNVIAATKSVTELCKLIFGYAETDEKRAAELDDSQLISLPNFGMF